MANSTLDFFVRRRITELLGIRENCTDPEQLAQINSELSGWVGPLLEDLKRLESERRQIRYFNQEIMPGTADRIYRNKDGVWFRRVDVGSLEFEQASPPRKLVGQIKRRLLAVLEELRDTESGGDA